MKNYKYSLFILCMLGQGLYAMRAPDDSIEAEKWYQSYAHGLAVLGESQFSDEKIEKLANTVSKLAPKYYYYFESIDPRWIALYEEARGQLESIPCHAEYFKDKMESARTRVTRGKAPLYLYTGDLSYFKYREFYFNRLFFCLRTPEMAKVLGGYLDDERDKPLEGAQLQEYQEAMKKLQDWQDRLYPPKKSEDCLGCYSVPKPIVPNCVHAMRAFQKIGIRDADFSDLEKCRAWWEEVKAGKKAFSFKGQKVEYRFKPDGTWETVAMVNPPNDLPPWKQAVQDRDDMKKREAAAQAAKAAEINRYGWWLSVPLTLGIMGWLRFKADTK